MKRTLKVLLVVIMSFFVFTSCFTKQSEKTLEKRMQEIRTEKLLGDSNFSLTVGLENLIKKFEYKIEKVDEKGDKSEITLHIKTVDLVEQSNEVYPIILSGLSSGLDEKGLNAKIDEYFANLKDEDLKYMEKTMVVNLSKTNNVWNIDNEDEILNYIKGDLANKLTENKTTDKK